jgi:HlyD family secretion protein
MNKTSWGLTIMVLAGAFVAVFQYTRSTDQTSSETTPRKLVEVVSTSLQTKVSETGTIMPSQTIEIKSQFSGEVAQLFVTAGQEVQKDHVLAIIRQESSQARQVAQLRAGIQEERLNVDIAHREWGRAKSLFKKGFIPKKEMELSQRDYQQSLVRLELAERQLLLALGGNQELFERYREGSVSKTRPEEFQVRSPSQGTVLEILVHTGEIITSGTATFGGGTVLMRIADLSHMVVKAKINEVNIPRVSVGQPVDIRLDALPGQFFKGRVKAIATQGVKENNLVTYEVSIDIEHSHPALKPMLTANIDIETKRLDNVLTVPLEVLRVKDGDDVVDVWAEGQTQTRKVRVAFRTDTHAIITQGLQEHDQVVIPSFKTEEARR